MSYTTFRLNKQELYIYIPGGVMVEGSKGTLKAKLDTSADWQNTAVTIHFQNTDTGEVLDVTPGTDGTFLLDEIPAGTYRVFADGERAGYRVTSYYEIIKVLPFGANESQAEVIDCSSEEWQKEQAEKLANYNIEDEAAAEVIQEERERTAQEVAEFERMYHGVIEGRGAEFRAYTEERQKKEAYLKTPEGKQKEKERLFKRWQELVEEKKKERNNA